MSLPEFQQRPLIFTTLAFLFSYGFAFGAMALGLVEQDMVNHIAVLGPTLAALVAVRAGGGKPFAWLIGHLTSIRPSAAFFALPIFVATITAAPFLLAGASLPDAKALVGLLAVQILFIALPEEFGWRSYLTDGLLGRFNPLIVSLIVGAIWGLWHGPKLIGIPMLMLATIALSILLTYGFARIKGGLWIAALTHGLFNATLYGFEPSLSPEAALAAYNQTALLLAGAAAILVFAERHWFLGRPTQTPR